MKKQILFIFSTVLMLILGGCGSNDMVDGSSSSTVSPVVVQKQKIILNQQNGTDFTLSIPVVKQYDSSVLVKLENFVLEEMGGCQISHISYSPAFLELNGEKNSIKTVNIQGTFAAPCVPSGHTFRYTQTVSANGQTQTNNISSAYDYSNSTGSENLPASTGYSFYNTNTPLEVTKTNTGYDIKVQLLKDAYPAVGKVVKLRAFNNIYGDIAGYNTSTGTDGYATFQYTSPSRLPVNGSSATLTVEFIDDANHTLTKELLLTFNSQGTEIDPNTNTALPITVVPASMRSITLSNNSQSYTMDIRVYKDIAPYSLGSVKVELPLDVLEGIDVGSFSAYEVPVNEQGIATFHYTGPSNLQALVAAGKLGSTFKFYHTENSAVEARQPMTTHYNPSDDYIPVNYKLEIITEENDFSMGIPDIIKTFNVTLTKIDGTAVNPGEINITKIEVKAENSLVAQLWDTASSTMLDEMEIQKINSSPFILKSKKLSGIVPLTVTMYFTDINNEVKEMTITVNVRVLSGPPSSISISYASTDQDSSRAKYIEKFAISVSDEYGNSVNTRPYISIGAIAGYAVDGSAPSSTETASTKRLFYGRSAIMGGVADGELDNNGDTDPHTTSFNENVMGSVFKYVNAEGPNTDKLVIFGAGKNYEAMGKWDFERVTDDMLQLQDDYAGITRSGLSYAIGHNYYQDQCREDGREWTGSTDSDTYQLDDQGTVLVSYKYDYHLAGKDILLWVNLNGIQPDTGDDTRIGEAVKHTLRTTGLKHIPEGGYTVEKGTSKDVVFHIHHENAPEWYRNAHFGAAAAPGSTCAVTYLGSSNDVDARTCSNGNNTDGTSYISLRLTAAPDKDCTYNLTRVVTSSEF